LQEQHEEQIKEIRKAGHDTLAVIVEEYKVLMKLYCYALLLLLFLVLLLLVLVLVLLLIFLLLIFLLLLLLLLLFIFVLLILVLVLVLLLLLLFILVLLILILVLILVLVLVLLLLILLFVLLLVLVLFLLLLLFSSSSFSFPPLPSAPHSPALHPLSSSTYSFVSSSSYTSSSTISSSFSSSPISFLKFDQPFHITPKELSRKAVLEQREENKIQMEKLLEDQRKKFQEFLQEQVKTGLKVNEPLKTKMSKIIADLIIHVSYGQSFFKFWPNAQILALS